jgi:hypothetical protein
MDLIVESHDLGLSARLQLLTTCAGSRVVPFFVIILLFSAACICSGLLLPCLSQSEIRNAPYNPVREIQNDYVIDVRILKPVIPMQTRVPCQ